MGASQRGRCLMLHFERRLWASRPPSPQLRRCVNHVYTQNGSTPLCWDSVYVPVLRFFCVWLALFCLRVSLCVFQRARSSMCNWWLMRQLAPLIAESISWRWLTFEHRVTARLVISTARWLDRGCPRRASSVFHSHVHTLHINLLYVFG